jgi:hypothetical protein
MSLKFLAVWPEAAPVEFEVPAGSGAFALVPAAIKALEGFLRREIPGDSVSASLLSLDDVDAVSKRADAPVTRRDFRRVGAIAAEVTAGGILVEPRSRKSAVANAALAERCITTSHHTLALSPRPHRPLPAQAARRTRRRRQVSCCAWCLLAAGLVRGSCVACAGLG